MFKVSKGRIAISVVGSEDKHVTHKPDVSNADSFGIIVPMRAQSIHLAGNQHEYRQQGTSEPIYFTSPKELRARLQGTADKQSRHVIPKPLDTTTLRVSGGRERRPYGSTEETMAPETWELVLRLKVSCRYSAATIHKGLAAVTTWSAALFRGHVTLLNLGSALL